MTRAELPELHFIAPIDNLASIIAQGILCHERAKNVGHRSVAMEEIQERRRKVIVPGGLRLHQYANLYINARNKMMFKLKAELGDAGLAVRAYASCAQSCTVIKETVANLPVTVNARLFFR
jgi:hypothetical protein